MHKGLLSIQNWVLTHRLAVWGEAMLWVLCLGLAAWLIWEGVSG